MAKSTWPTLCETVRMDDGLSTRDVGAWSEDKLYFLHQYIGITSNAMGGKQEWEAGLIYVDLFAGPGVCAIRDSGRRIPGSALIAASAPKPFTKILLAEMDPELAAACEVRMRASPARDRFKMFVGDCNQRVSDITREIPEGALVVAFVDPPGLDDRFETIAALAACGSVDLLILFADAFDIVRNVDRYEQDSESKLDQKLGPGSEWRSKWNALENRSGVNVREFFSDVYTEQLRRRLGYLGFGVKPIESRRGPLYRLIYASKHPRGLEFWNKIVKRDKKGQSELF